jgi:tRNA(Ile)-lysidine synthase
VDIFDKFAEFCRKNALLAEKEKIVVGVSGGADSLALLHLLNRLRNEFDLTLIIAHLNHGLRGPEAIADEAFVRATATAWTLPIFVESRNVVRLAKQYKQSLEEAARQVRYTFLWQVAAQTAAAKVAVGHNADDQVETVLMHFLRGSGLAGLRGMMPETDLAGLRLLPEEVSALAEPAPRLIRPLLELSRLEIEAYCRENGLVPRQDSSNQDNTFFRNRLRHELIPYLEDYNPNIRQVIQRMTQVVTAEVETLNEGLAQAWVHVVKNASSDKIEFDLGKWLNLPLSLKRSTLRWAVHTLRRGLRDIGFEHIENAIDLVEKKTTGLKATLPQGLLLTVGYQSFIIAPADLPLQDQAFVEPRLTPEQVVQVNLPGLTLMPDNAWQLRVELLSAEGVKPEQFKEVGPWEAFLDAEVVSRQVFLRSRRPGDRYQPIGMGGHRQKINEFMINEKIPAARRDHIPLLVAKGQVLWVCGHRPDERARIQATTTHLFHLKFEMI